MFRKENLTNQLQKCFFLTTKKNAKQKNKGTFLHWNIETHLIGIHRSLELILVSHESLMH